ncbi:hypothetical protein OHA21_01130 [Actinoplanes sp. NBC_00393]|uniref:hypothetical protein n=1 Tax=Actinoplanes sp. NBC_00393 TaxID=2975953 RepID=UPI002E1CC674
MDLMSIVGLCGLAVLVLIVVAGYLRDRRRGRVRGEDSGGNFGSETDGNRHADSGYDGDSGGGGGSGGD